MENNQQTPQISIFEIEKEIKSTDMTEEQMPKPFQYLYYKGNIEKCDEGSKNSFRWKSLLTYAMIVKDFYTALCIEFNRTLDNPIALPEYMRNRHSLTSIDEIAQKLDEQEKKLFQTFDKDAEKIERKCEKHATLSKLREYAAISWMIYHNLKRENFYHTIIDYQTQKEKLNLSLDEDVAYMFMCHAKAENFVKTKVKGFYSTSPTRHPFVSMHPQTFRIYANMPAEKLFDEFVKNFNGYNYKENNDYVNDIIKNVTDENALQIIEFYKNYADIKYVYKKLFYINKQLEEYPNLSRVFIDIDNNRRDIFDASTHYFEQVSKLLNMASENEKYSFVVEDCSFILEKLAEAIQLNYDAHEDERIRREEALKNFPFAPQGPTI